MGMYTELVLSCPFCGADLRNGNPLLPYLYSHPGEPHDGACLLSGNLFSSIDLLAWNQRTVDTELLEALKAVRSYGCPVCSGDCGSANPPMIYCPMQAIDTAITKAEAGS